MFKYLQPKEQKTIIDAMEERHYKVGEKVIQQGDDGDVLYLVDLGELNCTKVMVGETESTFLKKYQPGEIFGELALLYNAPRAATVECVTDCVLFALDRSTFNHIVRVPN